MWHNNKSVVRTHARIGSQMAWAIVNDVGIAGWIRIRPNTPDGVMNVLTILTTALANGRNVDVFIVGGMIEQATLR